MQRANTARETAESPAKQSYAVTPHDSNEIGTYEPKGLYVGGAGNIAMRLLGDTADITWTGVQAGSILPVVPQYIRATGTTATGLIALV